MRDGPEVGHQTHNLEVRGSIPLLATKINGPIVKRI